MNVLKQASAITFRDYRPIIITTMSRETKYQKQTHIKLVGDLLRLYMCCTVNAINGRGPVTEAIKPNYREYPYFRTCTIEHDDR